MNQNETDARDDDDPFLITGKALDRHFSMLDALFEFSRLFQDERNDRALAIVGGAFLDTLLENILVEFLVDEAKEVGELLRYDQPLGTYSGRIRVAYCLGLLRKTVRDDLRLVGKIRNMFAHDLSAELPRRPMVNAPPHRVDRKRFNTIWSTLRNHELARRCLAWQGRRPGTRTCRKVPETS